MKGTIFSRKWTAILVSCLADAAFILSFFGASYAFIAAAMLIYFSSQSFKGKARVLLTPICFAAWGIYCIFDFSAPFSAVTNTPSVLTVGIFAGSLLLSVGSVLFFVGSLFEFEYLTLFRVGALLSAVGTLLSFIITTAFVLKDGGSVFGMNLTDIASTVGIFANIALCLAIFLFAKREKPIEDENIPIYNKE